MFALSLFYYTKYKYYDSGCKSRQFKIKISPMLPPNIIFAQILFQHIDEGCHRMFYIQFGIWLPKPGNSFHSLTVFQWNSFHCNTILPELQVNKISDWFFLRPSRIFVCKYVWRKDDKKKIDLCEWWWNQQSEFYFILLLSLWLMSESAYVSL